MWVSLPVESVKTARHFFSEFVDLTRWNLDDGPRGALFKGDVILLVSDNQISDIAQRNRPNSVTDLQEFGVGLTKPKGLGRDMDFVVLVSVLLHPSHGFFLRKLVPFENDGLK